MHAEDEWIVLDAEMQQHSTCCAGCAQCSQWKAVHLRVSRRSVLQMIGIFSERVQHSEVYPHPVGPDLADHDHAEAD